MAWWCCSPCCGGSAAGSTDLLFGPGTSERDQKDAEMKRMERERMDREEAQRQRERAEAMADVVMDGILFARRRKFDAKARERARRLRGSSGGQQTGHEGSEPAAGQAGEGGGKGQSSGVGEEREHVEDEDDDDFEEAVRWGQPFRAYLREGRELVLMDSNAMSPPSSPVRAAIARNGHASQQQDGGAEEHQQRETTRTGDVKQTIQLIGRMGAQEVRDEEGRQELVLELLPAPLCEALREHENSLRAKTRDASGARARRKSTAKLLKFHSLLVQVKGAVEQETQRWHEALRRAIQAAEAAGSFGHYVEWATASEDGKLSWSPGLVIVDVHKQVVLVYARDGDVDPVHWFALDSCIVNASNDAETGQPIASLHLLDSTLHVRCDALNVSQQFATAVSRACGKQPVVFSHRDPEQDTAAETAAAAAEAAAEGKEGDDEDDNRDGDAPLIANESRHKNTTSMPALPETETVEGNTDGNDGVAASRPPRRSFSPASEPHVPPRMPRRASSLPQLTASGMLLKKGTGRKAFGGHRWKRRWFEVRGTTFSYLRRQNDHRVVGQVSLRNYSCRVVEDSKYPYHFVLEHNTDKYRTYNLRADSGAELTRWNGALNDAIRLAGEMDWGDVEEVEYIDNDDDEKASVASYA